MIKLQSLQLLYPLKTIHKYHPRQAPVLRIPVLPISNLQALRIPPILPLSHQSLHNHHRTLFPTYPCPLVAIRLGLLMRNRLCFMRLMLALMLLDQAECLVLVAIPCPQTWQLSHAQFKASHPRANKLLESGRVRYSDGAIRTLPCAVSSLQCYLSSPILDWLYTTTKVN